MKRTLCFHPYDSKNRLALQTVNGTPVEYAYTPEGWLAGKTLGGSLNPVSTLKYFYAPDGQITGRSVDGKVQQYRYDAKDQLVAVLDADSNPVETYAYDPAGNILKKTVNGETTAYTYDGANQLVSSETDGILTTRYRYDAAGRLIGEGGKSYRYGWLDKVVSVSEEGQVTATFGYHAGGQLAAATHGDKTESFLWDGLALIRRDGTDYVNEPHAGGGAPVLAGDKVLFNDRLGSTLGIKGANGFDAVQRTAFGETGGNSAEEFFTGKPMVGELGYAFLLRNYRSEHGKWQTADLMGYPDGWNNLAYCNNRLTDCVDWMGGDITSSGFETYFGISLSIMGTRPGDAEPSNYTQLLNGTAKGSASCNHNFNNPVFSDFKVNKGESSLSLSSANGVDSITYGGKTYKPSMSFSFSVMLTSSTAILNEELSDERNKVFDLSITFNYVVSWTRTETGSFVTLTSDAFTGSKTINWRHTIPE